MNSFYNRLKSLLATVLTAVTFTAFAQVPPTPPAVAEPTSESTNLVFSNVTTTSMTLSWTKGNGAKRLVIAREGSVIDSLPKDTSIYTANSSFGSGEDLGMGQFVVYNGNGNAFDLSGLSPNKTYFFSIIEFNQAAVTLTNYMTSGLIGSRSTLATAPTINSSEMSFTAISENSFAVNFIKGNGSERLIIAKKGSATTQTPVDATTYTADNNFGNGSDLGAGNYVVYKGSANNFTLSNLLTSTSYYLSVYEYNGTGESTRFLTTTPLTGNQQTKAPKPTTGATSMTFADITETSMTLNWIRGNGSKRLVIAHVGSTVSVMPTDGMNYTADNNFYNGGDLGAGNYVIYNGNGNTCQVNGLSANTNYYFSVVEYNGTGTTTSYFTAGKLDNSHFTLANEPTISSGTLSFTSINETSLTLKLQPGNGSERILIAKQGSAVNQFPEDGKSYTDNLTFGSGADLGAGNYVVYKGTSNSVTVSGLTQGVTYSFACFEYNGSSPTANNYQLNNPAVASQQTVASEPSTQSSNILFTRVTDNSIDLKWSRGNGSYCIVLAKAESDVSKSPEDGKTYTGNEVFGSGSDLGAANYVIFNGNGNTCSAKGLDANKTYYFSVFEFNGSGITTNYFTATVTKNSHTTLTAEPTLNSSNMTFSNITGNSMTVRFTPGNGAERIVVGHKGSPVDQLPADGTAYNANASFVLGSDLGAGNYVLYRGTGSSVAVSGLTEATNYYFAVFEYNGVGSTDAINYAGGNIARGTQATLEVEPTEVASNVKFSNITETSMNVTWKNGNGSNHLVVARAAEVNKEPIDGVEYTASDVFGKGGTLNAGNYIVYNGSGSSVTVKGLVPNTRYFYKVFEFNGENSTNNYQTQNPATGDEITLVNKPTINAANLQISTIKDEAATVSWVNGNGQKRMVIVRTDNKNFRLPQNGKNNYLADPSYGGALLDDETYICYIGTETSFQLKNLEKKYVYYIAVIEFNESDEGVASYQTQDFPVTSNLPEPPTTMASIMTFKNVSKDSMTVSWTKGDGAYRILIGKVVKPTTLRPLNGFDYIADNRFGVCDSCDMGDANFVLYNGIGDSVNVTNLSPKNNYYFSLYEYNQEKSFENDHTVTNGPASYAEVPLRGNKQTLPAGGTTAINIIENDGVFGIYPNPGDGLFNVKMDTKSATGTIRVIDYQGRSVYQDAILRPFETQPLNLQHLSNGVYNVLLETDKGMINERVVILK